MSNVDHLINTSVQDSEMPTSLPNMIHQVLATATCLYSKEEIEVALDKMSLAMNEELAETNPILLCVVVGGIVTLGNLLPRLNFPLEVDYVHATRYGSQIVGKDIEWKVKPHKSVMNRTVVIVDDILDGGITLNHIIQLCQKNGAKQIYSAVLVDKKNARIEDGLHEADFTALEVDNHYVFGYGMDYKGYLRNAPGIYKVSPEFEA